MLYVFLHGLSTYSDEAVHVGPWALGRHDRFLRDEFASHGVRLHSIDGLGAASPTRQAELAFSSIVGGLLAESQNKRILLLGNSVGGLTARALQPRLEKHGFQTDVVTWGTPHRGASIASRVIQWHRKSRWITSTLAKGVGYDLSPRLEIFRHFTAEALEQFNSEFPERKSSHHFIACACRPTQSSPLLWPVFPAEPSDGFIELKSQRFGQSLGSLELDHFSEIGLTPLMTAPQRFRAKREFKRLVQVIVERFN